MPTTPTTNSNVEERIVEMRIDNKQFESGAKKTVSLLEKIDQSINNLGKAGSSGIDQLSESIDNVGNRFSVMHTVADQVIRNITNSAMGLTKQLEKMVASLTTQQIDAGWQKYADKVSGVQTIMSATSQKIGVDFADQQEQMEWVTAWLEKLNTFTDETSYNFTDMVNNIGKFTSNGIELDQAVVAMEGIATWAAISGANTGEASRAMYNLSQALATGSVKLIDWKSIENANMATREFKELALETAVSLGTLTKAGEDTYTTLTAKTFNTAGFNTELSEGWFSSEVLMKTLDTYGKTADELLNICEAEGITASEFLELMDIWEAGDKSIDALDDDAKHLARHFEKLSGAEYKLGLRAFRAAQEAKTFTEAIDATKDAVSTGWMNIFELMFGNYLQAKEFWTNFANSLYDIFAQPVMDLKDIVKKAFGGTGGTAKYVDSFAGRLAATGHTIDEFQDAFEKLDKLKFDSLINEYGSLEEAIRHGALTADWFKKILDSLFGNESTTATSGGTEVLDSKVEELREVAAKVLRGELGVGEERRKALEAMGWGGQENWDLIHYVAENMHGVNYHTLDIKNLLANGKPEYLVKLAEAAGYSEEQIEIMNSMLDDSDALLAALAEGSLEYGEAVDDAAGKTGRELFTEGLSNILELITQIVGKFQEAIEIVFGDSDAQADSLYAALKGFHDFTTELLDNETQLEMLRNAFVIVLGAAKLAALGIKLAFKVVKTVVGAVLDILGDIHNTITSIYIALEENGAIENFKQAWNDIVSIVQGIWEPVTQGVSEVFGALFAKGEELSKQPWFQTLVGWILSISAGIRKATSRLKSFIETGEAHEKILAFFTGVSEKITAIKTALGEIKQGISDKLSSIGQWFTGIFDSLKEKYPNITSLTDLFTVIGDWLSGITANPEAISATLNNILGWFGNMFTVIYEVLFGEADSVKARISAFFSNIFSGLADAIGNISITDMIQIMRLGSLFGLLIKVVQMVATFKDIESSVETIPNSISKMFTNIGEAFEGLGSSLKMNALLKAFAGLYLLARSLEILSKINQDTLTHVAVIVGALFLVISKVVTSIGKIKSGDKSVDIKKVQLVSDLTGALIGIALVIFALGSMLSKLASITDKKALWRAFIVAFLLIAEVMAAVVILINTLTNKEKGLYPEALKALGLTMLEIGGAMLIMGLAINSITKAVKRVAGIKTGLLKGALTVGAIIAVMAGMMLAVIAVVNKKALSPQQFMALGLAVIEISAAMLIMAWAVGNITRSVKRVSSIKGNLLSSILTVGAVIIVTAGVMLAILGILNKKALSPQQYMALGLCVIEIAAAMLIMAWAVSSITKSIKRVAGIKEGLLGSVITIGVIIILLGGLMAVLVSLLTKKTLNAETIKAIGLSILEMAAGTLIISWAIGNLVKALKKVNDLNLSFGQGAGAIAVLTSLGAILTGIIAIFAGNENGLSVLLIAAGILLVSLAIRVMAGALNKFLNVLANFAKKTDDIENLGRALGTLFGVAVLMLLFGAAIALVGTGMITFGAGMLLLSVALYVISGALGVLGENLPNFIEGIVEMGRTMRENVKDLLIGGAAFVALGLGVFLLSKYLGKLFSGKGADIGKKLGDFAKTLGTGIMGLISTFGTSIINNLPVLLKLLSVVLVIVMLHIVDLIPTFAEVIVVSIINLVQSIADSLRRHQNSLLHAVFDIVEVILETAILGLMWLATSLISVIGQLLITPIKNSIISSLDAILSMKVIPKGVKEQVQEIRDSVAGFDLGEIMTNEFKDEREVVQGILADMRYPFEETEEEIASVGEVLSEGLHGAGTDYSALINAEIPELQAMQEKWQSFIGGSGKGVMGFKDSVLGMLGLGEQEDSESPVADLVGDVLGDPSEVTETVNNYLGGLANIGAGAEGDGEGLINGFVGMVTGEGGLGDTLIGAFGQLTENADLSSAASSLGISLTGDTADGAEGEQTSVANALLGLFAGAFGDLTQNKDMSTLFTNMGTYISNGLANGIYANDGPFTTAMDWLAKQGFVAFQTSDFTDIQSPSKAFEKLARFIPLGIAKGVEENTDIASDSMVIVGSAMFEAMQDAMLKVAALANDDLEFGPRITPIVDMSNVANAAGYMNGAFSGNYGISASINSDLERRLRNAESIAAAVGNAGQTINGDNIVVNVYPSPGQDPNAIADSVIARISERSTRRGAAFG